MASAPLISRPDKLSQAEALCLLGAACGAFHLLFPHHWILFACLFLVPDLSLIGYLGAPSGKVSIMYNLMHNYVLPALLALLAVASHSALPGEISLIWVAHISMDRTFGYGLKYPGSFRFTHIQSAANPVIVPDDVQVPG